MSSSTHRRALALGLSAALLVPFSGITSATAETTYEYTKIDQATMRVVGVNSVEETGERPNGPVEKILDGNPNTYWHTAWASGVVQPPHHFIVKLSDTEVNLGKIALSPRLTSNGSGRVRAYQLFTSTDANCAAETFIQQATGEFDGEIANKAAVREIVLPAPVPATCVKFVQNSSWGGQNGSDPISPPESVASLAEFNAYTAVAVETPEQPEPTPVDPAVPAENLLTITDGTLSVQMHKNFPQVVQWELGGQTVAGNTGNALTAIKINEVLKDVTVTPAVKTGENTARWAISVDGTPDTFEAVATVIDGTWQLKLENLVDADGSINRVVFPDLNLVTLKSTDPGATVAGAVIGVNRGVNNDSFETVAALQNGERAYYMTIPYTRNIAFGMESNAIEDNTVTYPGSNRGSNAKWIRKATRTGTTVTAAISPGNFVWRGSSATAAIGNDEAPLIKIRPALDRNSDSLVNWEDGAIATREIRPESIGMSDVANTVITRIPFNIVSQATHPFLRTLDDTKRIALATDNLGQQVMLKGYQAEGHDSAHPDYGGHYNERAGGLDDLKVLVNEGKNWNASFGVHVNATESYSESHNFSEELLWMPPRAAWGWMNQSYYINGPKDLGTGNILERFQQFRDEVPENLNWLYLDVYYPDGWEPARLGTELQKQGWKVATEWADKFPEISVWSHWANDEKYGGSTNKGINSKIIRFVDNARRDVFNPHPILSNANVVEFEGWTGHVDYTKFIKNVWERNLPVKFLQQSNIMKWSNNEIIFENGTRARSTVPVVGGDVTPTDRTFEYDGAVVYAGGKYLLPWTDGGANRLYHWNPAGGTSRWQLTEAWRGQSSLKLYKLTDTGREEVGTVAVANGWVDIQAEANTAYVLYPASSVPTPKAPNWGQGSMINDPGFFSGTLNAWNASGNVSIEKTARANFQALIGAGEASISQKLNAGNLPAGTWNASAWVEIDPLQARDFTISVEGAGVAAAGLQSEIDGKPATLISTSRALNATASDEKLNTYFQRVRVTFTTTGGEVTLKLSAGVGDAPIRIDDVRLTKFVAATVPAEATNPIVFEDFENPDVGYWPFVTGKDNRGGDARTQLAERHAPYSQRGWYGKNLAGQVVQGGKLVDNVLEGQWSLQAHEENQGLILRTTTATVPFEAGHKYRISMDYQSGLADRYRFVTAFDQVADGQLRTTTLSAQNFGATTETEKFTTEFSVGSCGAHWFGIEKIAGGFQADLTMDNILVEDLGETDVTPACAELQIAAERNVMAGKGTVVATTILSAEDAEVTDVKHHLEVPEGWTAVPLSSAPSTMQAKGTSVQRWIVTPPADASGTATLSASATYVNEGKTKSVSVQRNIDVLTEAFKDGENYLSDLPFAGTPTNGWGPVERDQANGEQQQNDGPPIRIDGVQYAKGLGTHANSRIAFDLEAKCTSFSAIVGVDDAQPSRGTVQFVVEDGEGRVLAGPTPVLAATSAGYELTADITGVERLVLRVTNGGDNIGNDWGSWGNAKVVCDVEQAEAAPSLTVSPDSVEAGESYTVDLVGFAAEEATGDVTILEAETGKVLATLTPDETGAGTVEITVPADAEAGTVKIVATRANGDYFITAAGSVVVTANTEVTPPVTQTPIVEVDKSEVYQGEKVIITGKNFPANVEVAGEIHSDPYSIGTSVTDSDGSVTFEVTIPEDFPVGEHNAILTQVGSDPSVTASAGLEVLSRASVVDPNDNVDTVVPEPSAPETPNNPDGNVDTVVPEPPAPTLDNPDDKGDSATSGKAPTDTPVKVNASGKTGKSGLAMTGAAVAVTALLALGLLGAGAVLARRKEK